MKRLLLLLCLLLVAAAPSWLVSIDVGSEEIQSVDEYSSQTRPFLHGSWYLEIRRDTEVLAQTTFDPFMRLPDGSTDPVEKVSVRIAAPAAGNRIVLLDENRRQLDSYNLQSICGDGVCALGETCSEDCSPEADVDDVLATEESSSAWMLWVAGIAGILIIVLVIVLVVINRRKPVEMQTREL